MQAENLKFDDFIFRDNTSKERLFLCQTMYMIAALEQFLPILAFFFGVGVEYL